MPQRPYSSSDVPDFHTYPATPRDAAAAEGIEPRTNAPMVADSGDNSTVQTPRDPGSSVKSKVAEIKERGAEIASKVTEYTSDLREDAMAAGSRWSERAQENIRQLRSQAGEYSRIAVRDYPIHVIAAAGMLGLLCGIGIRIWRENRV